MKVLVTGATGYLGGHFCQFLKKQGHEVKGFIRNPKKAKFLDKSEIEYYIGDIGDQSSIEKALSEGFDVVINSVGFVSDRGPWKLFRKINVEGTENLAKAMVKSGVKRLIHISSVSAYGKVGMDISETVTPNKPSWFKYGTTKRESEEVLEKYDFDITVLRPSHIIGTNDRTGYIPVLYHSLRKSRKWINNGETLIPVVYVNDVCESLLSVLNQPEKTIGETYNVVSNEKITIKDVIQILHKELNMDIPNKSMSFRLAFALGGFFDFMTFFGIKPLITRMGAFLGGRSTGFNPSKLHSLGWKNTKSGTEMITEWAVWRRNFELKRKK